MRVAIIPDAPACMDNNVFRDQDVRDDGYAHYRAIRAAAEAVGGTADTFDRADLRHTDKVVVFNYCFFPEMALEAITTLGAENVFAIVLEPPGVCPSYYDPDLINAFGAYSLPVFNRPPGHSVYLGFPSVPVSVTWLPFEKKKLLVSVTSCKLYRFPGGLHEERIRAAKYFQRACPDQFDMYGHGWRYGRFYGIFSPHRLFPSYQGAVASKHAVMRQYKFCICYENTSTAAGYVSEKIFDAMLSGCVPIYLGAPDIEDHVPEACFIDRRQFSTHAELEAFIRSMTAHRYHDYIDAIRAYLASERYADMKPIPYARKILEILSVGRRSAPASQEGLRKLTIMSAMKGMRQIGGEGKRYAAKRFVTHARCRDWAMLARTGFQATLNSIGWNEAYLFAQMKRL